MRSFVLASAVLGLVSAAPAPQDIDFDLAYAVANPTYTVLSDATAQTVSYTPSAIFASALPQITSTADDDSVADATSTDSADLAKRTACAAQPSGYGPVPSPDTVAAFQSDTDFVNSATSAPVPTGYTQTFQNLNGSNNALGYMGYTTLKSYDVVTCANKCNAINGCMAINVYFERDPTVDPGTGSACPNPASTTTIKCVFWGGPVNQGNANNYGQYRNQFQVVIAGSNGYVNNTIANVPGYSTAVDLGNAAINAPYDKFGYNTYMGSAIFNNGPFNASLCAEACSAKSAYQLATAPTDGTPVQTCQFFNTYILMINSSSNLQGQYCAMYSETWSSSYATNVGQYRTNAAGGQDHFLIEYSYAYSNSTNVGLPNPTAAAYQASTDISYSSLQTFCSTLLGYSTATVTVTVQATTTTTPPVSISTTTAIVTATATLEQRGASQLRAAKLKRRTIASSLSTPVVLSKYPAAIITSACQLAASPVTQTSTITNLATQTADASTIYVTVTLTQGPGQQR